MLVRWSEGATQTTLVPKSFRTAQTSGAICVGTGTCRDKSTPRLHSFDPACTKVFNSCFLEAVRFIAALLPSCLGTANAEDMGQEDVDRPHALVHRAPCISSDCGQAAGRQATARYPADKPEAREQHRPGLWFRNDGCNGQCVGSKVHLSAAIGTNRVDTPIG